MLRETAAFRQGHREVLLSLILAIVKDLDDVRMIKLGDGLSFAVKAFELGWRRQNAAANGLQGHQAAELGVAGLVNDSHGPAFFFSSRRRHTRCLSDWSSDVCSSD